MIAYYYTYWCVCALFFLILIFKGLHFDVKKENDVKIDKVIAVLLTLFSVFYFGLRDEDIGTDTKTYLYSYYEMLRINSLYEIFESDLGRRDPLFYAYMFIISKTFNQTIFLLITSFFYITPISFVLFKFFKRDVSFCILFFLVLDVSLNLGINIIRSGLGISFSLLFMYYLFNKKSISLIIISGIIAIGFHQSSIIFLIIFVLIFFTKISIKAYYVALIISYILAVMKIGFAQLPIIGTIITSSERFASYSDGDLGVGISGMTIYITVFFGLTMILLFYFKNYFIKGDKVYDYFSKAFILSTIVYFLFLNIEYSYRFGVFSYVLLPFILIYPFSVNRFNSFNYIKLIAIILIYFTLSLYRVLPNL